MSEQLSNLTLMINNVQVAYSANSLVFDEGEGEQTMRTAATGGGGTERIYSRDIESEFGMIKFDIPSTIENVKKKREWKVNKDQNVVSITGRTADGTISKTFTRAALLNRVEVNTGTDGHISIEFSSNPAV